uniref:Uncharacterized protein n=1 Tax=Anopheles culicifacies TaxID=139723 RepID=A0A182MHU8_9DIPT
MHRIDNITQHTYRQHQNYVLRAQIAYQSFILFYINFSPAPVDTEPVGSKPPTFSSESKGSIFDKAANSSFALLCQAQAFPVPIMRTCRQCCTENFRRPPSGNACNKCAGFCNTLSWASLSNAGLQAHQTVSFEILKYRAAEPVGSVGPKISGGRLQEMIVESNTSFALLCLAQSFPVPVFR